MANKDGTLTNQEWNDYIKEQEEEQLQQKLEQEQRQQEQDRIDEENSRIIKEEVARNTASNP